MTQRKIERPEPPKAEPVPQELTEKAAEYLAQQAAQTQVLVPVPDARLEQLKGTNLTGNLVTRARDARTGKFIATIEAATQLNTKAASAFMLSVDKETGKSKAQELREHLFNAALRCEGKELGNAVKAADFLDETSGMRKSRDTALQDREYKQNVTTVHITLPADVKPMEERPAERMQPSFAVAEVTEQFGPSGMPRG